MDVDEALENLGGFRGRWQLVCFIFLSCSMMIPASLFLLNIIFIGLTPEHHCTVDVNVTLPMETRAGQRVPVRCYQFADNSTDRIPCQNGWTYETEDIGWTIVSQFDLVCDDQYMISLSQTILVGGMTVGSIVVSPLPDQFGRKPVHLITIFLLSISAIATSFSLHYVTFIVLRFCTGVLIIGSLSAMIAVVELFPATSRAKAGILVQIPWTIGMFLLLLLGYFIREWMQLQLISALIPLIFLFGYWVYPESVPWLVAQGRYAEAEEILQKAGVGSGVRMPSVILHVPPDTEQLIETRPFFARLCDHSNRKNFLVLVKSSMMRKHAAIMCCVWFCNALVYYGISFLSVTWAGDRFLNFFLNALVEIPAILICLFTLERFGRRLPLFSFHIGAGLSLLLAVLIPTKFGDVDLNPLIVTLNILAKTFITSSFDGIWLYSPELFPTNLRSTGIGLSQFGARAGAMIAPFSMSLANTVPWLPGVIFSLVALVCGALMLFLPETFDKPLAQTLTDMQYWSEDTCFDALKLCCKRLDRVHEFSEEEIEYTNQTECTVPDLRSSMRQSSIQQKKLASDESTL